MTTTTHKTSLARNKLSCANRISSQSAACMSVCFDAAVSNESTACSRLSSISARMQADHPSLELSLTQVNNPGQLSLVPSLSQVCEADQSGLGPRCGPRSP